jgi:hypothetical protein
VIRSTKIVEKGDFNGEGWRGKGMIGNIICRGRKWLNEPAGGANDK